MIRAYIGDCKNVTNAVKVSSKYGEKFYVWRGLKQSCNYRVGSFVKKAKLSTLFYRTGYYVDTVGRNKKVIEEYIN